MGIILYTKTFFILLVTILTKIIFNKLIFIQNITYNSAYSYLNNIVVIIGCIIIGILFNLDTICDSFKNIGKFSIKFNKFALILYLIIILVPFDLIFAQLGITIDYEITIIFSILLGYEISKSRHT